MWGAGVFLPLEGGEQLRGQPRKLKLLREAWGGVQVLLLLVPPSWIGHRGLAQVGKPGSPWQRGPWPSRTTWLLNTELLGPGCPCSPTCHCVVWAGLCPRDFGASHGKAAPCPGWWGHGAPHKMQPRGAVQGSVCAHLHWTRPTPSCAHTRKLTCAHTFICTPVYARAVCFCIRMPMYVYAHTCSCTCAHACTHVHTCSQHTHIVYGLVHMHLYTRVPSHTPLHTSPRTHLPCSLTCARTPSLHVH